MKVQMFQCDYGDGDKVPYIIFDSGVVMYNPDGEGWAVSRYTAEHVKESIDFDFVDWVPAPCSEAI